MKNQWLKFNHKDIFIFPKRVNGSGLNQGTHKIQKYILKGLQFFINISRSLSNQRLKFYTLAIFYPIKRSHGTNHHFVPHSVIKKNTKKGTASNHV